MFVSNQKNNIMAKIISREKELIRINPTKRNKLEYSRDNGRTWLGRYTSNSCGDFRDLTDSGKEIPGITSKGLYFSRDEGRTCLRRG
jgi:hypothetical protein